jgi:uncharacterized protein (DUF736 family)
MATAIATLTTKGESFQGMLHTLTANVPISVIPNADKRSDMAPDYRIVSRNGLELGAGWTRVGKTSGEEYISVSLAAPEIGKIYGTLVPAPGEDPSKKVILWNPPS